MSGKSMYIMDTPYTCAECPMKHQADDIYMGDYTYKKTFRCYGVNGEDVYDNYITDIISRKKPKWCPLKPYKED